MAVVIKPSYIVFSSIKWINKVNDWHAAKWLPTGKLKKQCFCLSVVTASQNDKLSLLIEALLCILFLSKTATWR